MDEGNELYVPCTENGDDENGFQVSLDLQWDYCSDQLTLICTHSNVGTNPFWVYNGATSAGGVALENIPGAEYTVATSTRHVAVVRGIENVTALDSFTFQCVYHPLNSVRVRSNKEQYYWGYAEENSFVDYGNSFCYYNCTVDVSMAPQCGNHANISVSSSPPTANQSIRTPNGLNYNISDLQRCQRYTVEVTARVGAHKYTNQTQGTVMLRPGRVEIVDVKVSVEEERSQMKVTLRKSEDDCDGHETTRYTFFIGDKEVGDITADMLGLSFFNKTGDMAVVTLTVLTSHIANSPWFNLTVVLSNTVEFTEVITSSTDGVSSTLQSNTWSTTSDPFYCENCNATPTTVIAPNNPQVLYIAVGTVVPGVLLIVAIVTTVAIVVCCKKCILTKVNLCERLSPSTAAMDSENVNATSTSLQEPQVEHKHFVLQRGEDAFAMTVSLGDSNSNSEEDNQEDSLNTPVDDDVTTSQEKAARHQTVYAEIDHTKKGPIPAPPVEQL